MVLNGKTFDLLPDPATIYYLYNSLKLFYENGGGTAYIVSAGLIEPLVRPGKPLAPGSPLVNPRVLYADLHQGLQTASKQNGITIVVIPDAVLLPQPEHTTLMQDVLAQCGVLQDRVGLLDVHGAEAPDPVYWNQPGGEIETFRTAVGTSFLSYGIAYFPFLKTTVVQDQDINPTNLGGAAALASLLPGADADPLKAILAQIQNPSGANPPTPRQLDQALMSASADYTQLHNVVLQKINTLPPSGAMAGVFTMVDNNSGVWQAPANVSLTAVTDTTLKLTDSTQATLNVDAANGKSVNAIRLIPGLGVMVWGARTLDGNSQDWRYISVRRTLIMIEQSLKGALQGFAFAPNDSSTWAAVQSMAASFLSSVWTQGGLVGPTAASAFTVTVGLGASMTSGDILNGLMRLNVQVAVTHPAEFITISIEQQMPT